MSVVEGFGGLRIREDQLHFSPKLPQQWQGYAFKINFRGGIVTLNQSPDGTELHWSGNEPITVHLHGQPQELLPEMAALIKN